MTCQRSSFQREVLDAAFALVERTDGPVLEDFREVIDDQTEEGAACPMPPRDRSDLPPAVDEAIGLRNAFERNLTAAGRTQIGRIADAEGVPGLVDSFVKLADGASLESIGWSPERLRGAAHDIRAYYEEAGIQLANVTGARQIETWLYQSTETGAVIRAAQEALQSAGHEHDVWFYLRPGTQAAVD